MKRFFCLISLALLAAILFCACDTFVAAEGEEWKSAYLDVVDKKENDIREFALVYLDGDDVPELYVTGSSEADGNYVYAYKNGELLEQRMGGAWSAKYIEKTGAFGNQSGSTGFTSTWVYKLDDNGFSVTFRAESFNHPDDNGEFVCEYAVGEEKTDEEAYNAALKEAFDFEGSKRFAENRMSAKDIRNAILAFLF